jgi:alpha-ribazole phosphatase
VSRRQLYLVRHPRPLAPPGVCYGATDVPVDPQHLQAVVQSLSPQLPRGTAWRVSQHARARELAQAMQAHGFASSLGRVDPRLNEMDFGDWEMRPWDAIDPAALQAWTDGFATYRCGGHGESAGMLIDRVASVCRETLAPDGGDEVWFTHAGVIRAVQWLVGQKPSLNGALVAGQWPAAPLPYGSVTRFWVEDVAYLGKPA